jgi:hypothetical protein
MSILKGIRITGRLRGDYTEDEYLELEKELNRVSMLEIGPTRAGQNQKVKKGTAAGEQFDSQWEFALWIYMNKIVGTPIRRNHEIKLSYIDENGKHRKWVVDFIGGPKGMIEVKGRETITDRCKRETHPSVDWYDSERMKPIIKEVYKRYPNWKSDYIEKI